MERSTYLLYDTSTCMLHELLGQNVENATKFKIKIDAIRLLSLRIDSELILNGFL